MIDFEKHHIVSPYLAIYKMGHSMFGSKAELYEAIAKALQVKLVEYEEQEALQATEDTVVKLYRLLGSATDIGDLETIETASKAIQRLR